MTTLFVTSAISIVLLAANLVFLIWVGRCQRKITARQRSIQADLAILNMMIAAARAQEETDG